MKKIVFLAAIIVFVFSSCSKEPKMVIKNGVATETSDDDSNNSGSDGYTWTHCDPSAIIFEKSEFDGGAGNDARYWYYFRVSLNNSQANPNSATSASILIPHVGPQSTTIYDNVSNDATYEVLKIEKGYVFFRILTANVTSTGCPLKFNLALKTGSTNAWFSANGYYTQNVGIDDGTHNVYFIRFLNGQVFPAF